MGIRIDLPELRRALEETPAASAELLPETSRRYYLGELPAALLWVLRHPRVAGAIHEASKRLTDDERIAIREGSARKPRGPRGAPRQVKKTVKR